MAQDPNKPKNDGKIGLPSVTSAMNRIAPSSLRKGGRGAGNDSKSAMLAADDEKGKKLANGMTPQEQSKLLIRAVKRFDRCSSAESDNRKAAVEDLKFLAGDQWPADIMAQRAFDKRPCLTINKLPTFLHQITNDLRQNRPAIHVSPVGDKGDVEVAKMYAGLIRNTERMSSADIAYDTSIHNQVANGFGYFRLVTECERPNSFDQVPVIKRIRNPFTVYMDPDHQEPDGSDSKYGFITEMIPRSEFEEDWPDADPISWSQAGAGESMKQWVSQDSVRIAEYFEIKTEKRTLVALSNGHVGWEDELSKETWDLIDRQQITIDRRRVSDSPKVMWFKLTCNDVLEATPWLGKWIPIIKVIGDELDVEGKVKLSGIIRNAKDSQRQVNFWETMFTETVALAPKAPFIMEEGQVEGHEQQWKQANIKSYPYLLYKNVNLGGTNAPPPQRQAFAAVPAGIQQGITNASQNMMATTGIRFDATLQERTNDESGKAIRELRRAGDLGSFHYADNFSRSLRHLGRMLIDLYPKIYDTKRVLMILREDDKEEYITIDPNSPKPMMEQKDPQTGKTMKIFNPTYGEYGVTVTIGPSYATKRIEASESMIAFIQAVPAIAPMVVDLVAKNQDWPGGQEFAARLAKVVAMAHPGIMSPDIKDVPPQVQAVLLSMQEQIKQLSVERAAMMKALGDQTADRAQRQDKIDKDFELKLMKMVSDVEIKFALMQEKSVENFNTHIGTQIQQLGTNVTALMQQFSGAPPAANEGDGQQQTSQDFSHLWSGQKEAV